MPSENKQKEFITDQDVEEVGRMLRDMRSPDDFLKSASRWIDSSIYDTYRQKDAQASSYQVLKTILGEILKDLERENAEYAQILTSRFWKGLSAKETVLSSPWSERTFFLLQSKAIRLFAFLLHQKEHSLKSLAEEKEAAPARAVRLPAKKRSALYAGIIAVLLLSLPVIYFARGLLLPAAEPTPPAASSPAAVLPTRAVVPSALPQEDTPEPVSPTPVPSPSPEPAHAPSLCGELERSTAPGVPRLVRHQGVSAFTVENTEGAVLSDRARIVVVSPNGLWTGYFEDGPHPGGVGHYDKTTWADCRESGAAFAENVNDILVAPDGTIWIAYERHGVAAYDGSEWTYYTSEDGLPSSMIYGLSRDEAGNLWAGTWEGVARFDGESWSVPYSARNDTIFNDRVHDIAFDSQNNIWVGHVADGVSQYDPASGSWIYHTAARSGLAGSEIRDILVVPASQDLPEEVWIGTRDGGISRYTDGEWTTFDQRSGLISSNIRDLEIDRFRRVWAATDRGVVYQTESGWTTYNTLDTYHIAIGPSCPDKSCIFDEDVVWTATNGSGLTHSRLPLPEPVLDIRSVCLVDLDRERECLDLSPLTIAHTPIITATYTKPLKPGDIMRMEVTAVTRPPYQLRQDRGDFLSNADASDFNLFGAYPIIPVLDAIEPGQPFTFTDFDNPFIIPDLDNGQQEQTFVSSWRVWMHTRYVGPKIQIVFTVAGE